MDRLSVLPARAAVVAGGSAPMCRRETSMELTRPDLSDPFADLDCRV